MNKIIIIIAAFMAFSSAAFAADNSVTVSEVQAQKSKKAKAEIKEVNFHVHLHCQNCVKKVQENIAFEKGVKDLKVTQHSIYIKYDSSKTNEATLKTAIEKLGYKILEETHDHN
jgi:copper chaperone CopZ